MDLTSKLPDEVLCEVFSHITSLPHRFRLAVVDQKFRRCVFREMRKPQPLEIDILSQRLCGHQIPVYNWLAAVEVLAKEARFSRILIPRLCFPHISVSLDLMAKILHRLANMEEDCFSQVTSIKALQAMDKGTVEALLVVISRCKQLAVLEFEYRVANDAALDLASSLKDKPMTELTLDINCSLEATIDILKSIKSNTLRKVEFVYVMSVDLVQLMKELCNTAAESLEEIKISTFLRSADYTFFECIPHLPSLSHLYIKANGLQKMQFISAMKIFLSNNSARATPLVMEYIDNEVDGLTCCQLLDRIRAVQGHLPGTLFGFDESTWKMKLSLGNAAIGLHSLSEECGDPTCHDCRSCYPIVVRALALQAEEGEEDGHLEDHWLNRCKMENVVQHINSEIDGIFSNGFCGDDVTWLAMRAEENQAHDLANITFKRGNGTQFLITVNTGRCFDTSCTKCLVI